MKVLRGVKKGVKPSVEDLVVDRYMCWANVKVQKHQIQEMRLDRSTRCQESIEWRNSWKAWESLGKEVRSQWERFRRWKDRGIEREIERNEVRIAWGSIYRTSVKLDRWRCREVSRIWPSTNTCVEQVSRYKNIKHKRWGLIDPPGVETLSRGQELSQLIHQVSRRCRDCDKKKHGSSTDS